MSDKFTKFENMQMDSEPVFRKHCPSLFNLLGNNRLDWNTINSSYKKEMMKRTNEFRKKGIDTTMSREISFFHLVDTKAKNEFKSDDDLKAQYKYMTDAFEKLAEILNEEEKKKVKQIVHAFLTQHSRKFKNFLGELNILCSFKANGYTVVEIEEPIFDSQPDGTSIDFKFKKENDTRYIEVLSLHLNEENTSNDLKLERVVEKIAIKFIDKGYNKEKDYSICPVLWGQFNDFVRIQDYIKRNPLMDKVYRPIAFMIFEYDNDNWYMVDELDKIIDREGPDK